MHTPLSVLLREKPHSIVTVPPTNTVFECIEVMNKHNVGAVLVVEQDKLLGVFTERDMVTKVGARDLKVKDTLVKDVMTANVLTVSPKTTVAEAMATVTQRRFRHLPVVEGGRLIGMISSGDLTRWVTRNQEITIRDLESYITGEHNVPPAES